MGQLSLYCGNADQSFSFYQGIKDTLSKKDPNKKYLLLLLKAYIGMSSAHIQKKEMKEAEELLREAQKLLKEYNFNDNETSMQVSLNLT